MERIRKRTRLDTLVNQRRVVSPLSWSRWIYLGLVAALALFLGNYVVGDAVLLRADGIVLTDRHIFASTYPAKVSRVNVREGQQVQVGTALLEMESAEMLKDISDLAARTSDLSIRGAEIRNQRATISTLLPLAERHTRESATQIARLDSLNRQGLVSLQRMDQALGSDYEASSHLAELKAQSAALDEKLSLVVESNQRAAAALAQLEAFYDRGIVRATVDGVVGARVPVPGQVVKVGDELLQVNGRNAYILAYLPDIYLFNINPGERVSVSTGSHHITAEVESILTVADALPAEFQNMFRPRDRSRLIRIKLPDDHGFAVSQKVRVSGCIIGWC